MSEKNLYDYESVGIRDSVCMKLEPRNGFIFRTATFQVSCKAELKDLF